MGHITNGYGALLVFFCHELPPVKQTSQVTIRDLETDGTGTVSES